MKVFESITLIIFILVAQPLTSVAQKQGAYDEINSGIPWFDDRGELVSAHGACIVKEKGKFYLFGEKHLDNSNVFVGFNCYSSRDLYNWKFESLALPVQVSGALGPNSVGERVKVMKCHKTGEFVMYMHSDSLGYKDQYVGYATSANITGPYKFKGPLLFDGKPIKKWDMGTFQDHDGKGYVLIHGGEIYQLSDDFKSIIRQVNQNMESGFESPAIFKKDNLYYFLGSHLTSWERNDNYYFTATSLNGPWTSRGIFAPKGTLTWNSQTTFVLPIEGEKDTTFMFMGDRWSFPYQASSATYIWQPMSVSGTALSLPVYHESWKVDLEKGTVLLGANQSKVIDYLDKKYVTNDGKWKYTTSDSLNLQSSDVKGAVCSIRFSGKQISLSGMQRPDGGYAKINLTNSKGKTIISAMTDMYCKYAVVSQVFLSPKLARGEYELTITVLGEHGTWADKRKTNYGSTGDFISLEKIMIKQ